VPGKRARIGAVAQEDQRCELVEEAGRLNGGRDQDEEGVQQGEPSVHNFEQLVENHRQGDIGRGDHHVRREPGPVEQLVGLDVLGRGCEVAFHDQHGGNDGDGEGASDDVDQVQGPAILASRRGEPPARESIKDLPQLVSLTSCRERSYRSAATYSPSRSITVTTGRHRADSYIA
jgi:hypothetical protein